jgi:hypothetical protein
MSALAMILTAAMAVPGDGPEKVTGKIAEEAKLQRLDLSGDWKGKWTLNGHTYDVMLRDGALHRFACPCQQVGLIRELMPFTFIDEGRGKLKINSPWSRNGHSLGIYRQQGDKLVIYYCDAEKGRPTAFRAGEEHNVLIFHRVKSRK